VVLAPGRQVFAFIRNANELDQLLAAKPMPDFGCRHAVQRTPQDRGMPFKNAKIAMETTTGMALRLS
jgi:hypothetical protein